MLRLRRDMMVFPEGKEKAFTLSYDDGIKQDERFIKLLKSRNLACTFNLNTGLMGDNDHLNQPGIDCTHYKFKKEEILSIYDGYEIAVHSHTHPDLITVGEPMVAYELITNRKELEDLVHHPVRGMAYPMGTHNQMVEDVAKSCGIAYARTVNATHDFSIPSNFLTWDPTCHHTDERLMSLTDEFLTEATESSKLFYVWGHTYEFDAFDGWSRMEQFLDRIAGHEDVWYATNIEIFDYVNAYRNLIYSATGDYIENQSCLDVWIKIDGVTRVIKSGACISCEP